MTAAQQVGIKKRKMKTIITGVFLGLIGIIAFIGFGKYNSYPVFFDKNGQLTSNQVRIWGDTVVPTTASGQTIDYSSAGFTTIKKVTITAQFNSATITSLPLVVIKSFSNTSASVNILTQNNATTTILGITVLSGSPLQFASSTTGMILHVEVLGY